MHSIKTTVAASFVLFLGTRAQSQYTIDPNSVPLATRQDWCNSQQAVCPLLCLQLPGASATTLANTCQPTTLTYTCTCGNGLSPNASEYSQTLPFYLCQQWVTQCVNDCAPHDSNCQSQCTQQHPCGALNPTRVNTSTSSAMPSTTAPASGASSTAGQVFTGFGGAAASATATGTPKSGAQAAFELGHSYGIVIIATALFAGFVQLV